MPDGVFLFWTVPGINTQDLWIHLFGVLVLRTPYTKYTILVNKRWMFFSWQNKFKGNGHIFWLCSLTGFPSLLGSSMTPIFFKFSFSYLFFIRSSTVLYLTYLQKVWSPHEWLNHSANFEIRDSSRITSETLYN